MELKVFVLFALFVSINCQSLNLGQALSQQSSAISGQLSDLQKGLAAAIQTGLPNLSTQTKDALTAVSTQAKDVAASLKDQLATVLPQAQAQLANVKDAVATQLAGSNAKDVLSNLTSKIGDTVGNIVNGGSKNLTNLFWSNDISTKFHTSAQKLLDFKGIDAKYDAPKSELANYMVNSKSQPNITDMINLARKHLSPEEAGKFFDQMASIAEQQKW